MFVVKRRAHKEYLLKLKKEINDFIVNFKKRYQRFPWNQVNKVSKITINSTSPISINGHDYTVKEVVTEINKIKTRLQTRMKPSSFNHILRAYLKDAIRQDDERIKTVYENYHNILNDEFSNMKNDLYFCLEGLKEINKIMKNEMKNIKESVKEGEFEMFENNEMNTELLCSIIEAYEDILFDDDFEDEVTTEGANIDSTKIFLYSKKEIRTLTKKYKKALKEKNFNEARSVVDKMIKSLDKVEKELDDVRGGKFSTFLGIIINGISFFAKELILLGIPLLGFPISGIIAKNYKGKTKKKILAFGEDITILGMGGAAFIDTINGIKKIINDLTSIARNVNTRDEIDSDIFNLYKNDLIRKITELKTHAKKLNSAIDKLEKKYKEEQKAIKKAEKTVKESAEYKDEKLAIYESCSKGDITIEEREELLEDLNRKYFVKESIEPEVEVVSNKEKFDKVRKALYEKCSQGLITVEEREKMVMKAKDIIFENTDEVKPEVVDKAAAQKVQKEEDKAAKEIEKVATEN